MVMPAHVMTWIAGVFPLFSFLAGAVVYALWRNAWLATLLVAGVTVSSVIVWFSAKFWPWWLLYLFLCWLGNWAGHAWQGRQQRPHPAPSQR